MDSNKIWHNWLRPRNMPLHHICWQSDHSGGFWGLLWNIRPLTIFFSDSPGPEPLKPRSHLLCSHCARNAWWDRGASTRVNARRRASCDRIMPKGRFLSPVIKWLRAASTDTFNYTASQKTPTQTFYVNFGKVWPISIILSLMHSEMNCRRDWSKIRHLALNMLPHYLAKRECSNVQLLIDISQNYWHIGW